MQNVIFSTASDSLVVSHVLHAGPVTAYTPQNRKSESTHYFKLTTTHGAAFCHFKSEDSARKARGLFGAMLGTVKPHLFRSKGDCFDITGIVSFGRPVKLKNDKEEEGEVYGLPINMATVAEKYATVWLTFQTEDTAKNVRKALYASLMSYYNPEEKGTTPAAAEVEENNVVLAEVAYNNSI